MKPTNDEAFAGEAIRPGEEPVDAYYWRWLTPEERPIFLQAPVLVICPSPKEWYWRQVALGKLIAWRGCHAALLGVGSLPGHTRVSIYNRLKIEESMDLVGSSRNLTGSLVPDSVAAKMAALWVGSTVMKTNFGEKTPYYV